MKKGFTLAEVLVTLGIIGVVAALTLPSLTASTGKSKIGPALSKFVNTFENANRQYLADRGMDINLDFEYTPNEEDGDTYEGGAKDSHNKIPYINVINDLGNYINWAPVDTNLINNKKNIDRYIMYSGKGAPHKFSYDSCTFRQMKDGSLAVFVPRTLDAIKGDIKRENPGKSASDINKMADEACESSMRGGTCYKTWNNTDMGDYKGWTYKIYYDINGFKGPNKMAQDIFIFYWDVNGRLVPMGSTLESNLWRTSNSAYNVGYVKRCDPTDADPSKSSSQHCAGDVADHGWVASY